MENLNWETLTQAFAIGAFPWLTQFTKLKVHLPLSGVDTSVTNNFFASLFSASIFLIVSDSHPYEIINFPPWWWFILIAFCLSILLFGLYIFFMNNLIYPYYKWLILLHLIIYILIFSTLTIGFGELKIFRNYYVFDGQVTDFDDRSGQKAKIFIKDSGDNVKYFLQTNDEGHFKLLINKSSRGTNGDGINIEDCAILEVLAEGYKDEREDLYKNFSMISMIQNFEIHRKE